MRTGYGPRFRSFLVLAALASLIGGGVIASAAAAVAASSATLTMTSDPGDYIGGGQTYSYSTGAMDTFNSNSDGTAVTVALNGHNGDWWYLDFAAPAGQPMAPGTYTGAIRYPFQTTGPGLSIYGNGRGCNMSIGSFTVTGITFGPNHYLQTFDATFEQHCESATPALRGTIHIVNPPAPTPLTITTHLNAGGGVSRVAGTATVSGTVTCSQSTPVSINGTLTQRASRSAYATGSFSLQVACSSTPTKWQVTVMSSNSVPFNRGLAQFSVTASGFDQAYGQQVSVTRTANVRLTTIRYGALTCCFT